MLPYLILNILQHKPDTGYNVQKFINTSHVTHTWKASHQQVYRELNLLLKQEKLTVVEVPQQGKPNFKLYTITDKGREALEDWMTYSTPMETLRDHLCNKIVGATKEQIPLLRYDLHSQLRQLSPYLENLEQAIVEVKQKSSFEAIKQLITLEKARSHWRSHYEWLLLADSQLELALQAEVETAR